MQIAYNNELSPKEREIVNLIINKACFDRASISRMLKISKPTVAMHLANIYLKLNLPQNNIASIVWHYLRKEEQK